MNNVIIGNSVAAINAVESIRKSDKKSNIIMICDELGPAYSRVLTSYYIAGKVNKQEMNIKNMEFYKKNRVKTIFGEKALFVDTVKKEVKISNNSFVNYDRILIATGASTYFPDINGLDKKGVYGLRTKSDSINIKNKAQNIDHAVLLGGGLVSLKVATALYKYDIEVSIVIGSDQILSQMLDSEAAEIIAKNMKEEGYKILTGKNVTRIKGNKKVEGVELDSGQILPAELVIVGKGITPNTDFVTNSDINVDEGIIVNQFMQTNKENVYAAGDVAQSYDLVREGKYIAGTWPVAVIHGKTAGLNMAGIKKKCPQTLGMNVIEVAGITAGAIGITGSKEIKGYDEIIVKKKNKYRKLIIRDNKIVGGIFIGDIEGGGLIKMLIRKKISLDDIPSPKNLLQNCSFANYKKEKILKYFRNN